MFVAHEATRQASLRSGQFHGRGADNYRAHPARVDFLTESLKAYTLTALSAEPHIANSMWQGLRLIATTSSTSDATRALKKGL